MSQSVRQSVLFAGEDFTKIYQSFKNVNFQAYDYDTIRSALIEYIRSFYPEDFNDYVESSEFIAIIELLAYLGTSLSFRVDLNSRENFLDTAERRESIIRLARMLSYQPRRNIPSQGLLKITGVRTTERVLDSLGRNLADNTIVWQDPNNDDAYEQFIAILNAAFQSSNTFGRPFKTGVAAGVNTSVYRLNSVPFDTSIAFNLSAISNGVPKPVDIVNMDFDEFGVFRERHPNPEVPWHIAYRNDGNGLASSGTGFFTYFKQGTLTSEDFIFAEPEENRTQQISGTNINNQDVYVQKIDESGSVIEEWTGVPSAVGSNIAYNDIGIENRTIYSVITELNDGITLKFSDGNFGEVPRDTFRVWTRRSANENIVFTPEEWTPKSFDIPYTGNDGRVYTLTMIAELVNTVSNGEPSETNEDIKENAPQVFYTQNRMVNNEDYNTFPLTRGNEIAKLRAINRTHAGHSRYIDINDPTGTYSSVLVNSEDGALYKEYDGTRASINNSIGTTVDNILDFIQDRLRDQRLTQFFYDDYLRLVTPGDLETGTTDYRWTALNPNPAIVGGEYGVVEDISSGGGVSPTVNNTNGGKIQILTGARLKFQDQASNNFIWTSVIQKTDDPADANTLGPLTLSDKVPYSWALTEVIPFFRTTLTQPERDAIAVAINENSDFILKYQYENNTWVPTTIQSPQLDDEFSNIGSWLLYVQFDTNSTGSVESYTVTTRGVKYIFESAKDVRFFFNPDQTIYDINTGRSLRDEIVISGATDSRLTETGLFDETWTFDGSSGEWVLTGDNSIRYPNNYISLAIRKPVFVSIQPQGSVMVDLSSTNQNGIIQLSNSTDGNILQISYAYGTYSTQDVKWNIRDRIILPDGYIDQRKVEVIPVDLNENEVIEVPDSFDLIVDQSQDRVYFEKFTDFDDYEYYRVWSGVFVKGQIIDLTDDPLIGLTFGGNSIAVNEIDLIISEGTKEQFETRLTEDGSTIPGETGTLWETHGTTPGVIGTVVAFVENSFASQDIVLRTFYTIQDDGTLLETDDYIERVGKSFVDKNGQAGKFSYKWRHYAPSDVRIDPSVSNIHDMLLLTKNYYNQVLVWKEENRSFSQMPAPPTAQELRSQFQELNQFKMLSDQLVFKSGHFKVLFGPQAEEELRARFKVVKLSNPVLSDNEIKSGVIQAIDRFFDITNWDFGESFYYTELAAYVHQQLQNAVASVVIVPTDAESEFGNLFEIPSAPNELFISTARVDQVDIVRNLTETNLRVPK